MSIWNTGSVSTHIGTLVGWSSLPTGISGTTLNDIVEQEINFVELYTTDTIDSTAIPEKYQPSIIDLSLSKVLIVIDSQQGADSVSLGELSVSQGQGSNAELAKQLKGDAINRLKELGRSIRFKRVQSG